jgi:hypothetical protein
VLEDKSFFHLTKAGGATLTKYGVAFGITSATSTLVKTLRLSNAPCAEFWWSNSNLKYLSGTELVRVKL